MHLSIVLHKDKEFAVDFTYDVKKTFVNSCYVSKPIDSDFTSGKYQSDYTSDDWLTDTIYRMQKHFAAAFFSVSRQMRTVILWIFLYGHSVYLFVSELNNAAAPPIHA